MGYAITRKGQVTLPKRVRDTIGVETGEEVEFRMNDRGEVVVEKAGDRGRTNRFSRWRGLLGPGPSTDEIMALTRGVRSQRKA
jgi:AbrB family looped-hinge helix DNA binding protein